MDFLSRGICNLDPSSSKKPNFPQYSLHLPSLLFPVDALVRIGNVKEKVLLVMLLKGHKFRAFYEWSLSPNSPLFIVPGIDFPSLPKSAV